MTFNKRLTPSGRKMLAFLSQHHVPTQHPLIATYTQAIETPRITDADLLAAVLLAHYHACANGNTTLVVSMLHGVTAMAGYKTPYLKTPLQVLQHVLPPLSAFLTKQRPKPLKQLREEAADIASTLYVVEMAIANCRSECRPLLSLTSLFESCL